MAVDMAERAGMGQGAALTLVLLVQAMVVSVVQATESMALVEGRLTARCIPLQCGAAAGATADGVPAVQEGAGCIWWRLQCSSTAPSAPMATRLLPQMRSGLAVVLAAA
jgi:hypothetical protein